MKCNDTKSGINYPLSALGFLFALTTAQVQAGAMGPTQVAAPVKVYFGVFGGGGSSNHVRINQYGTAFFEEAVGGPLAVNAFGHTNSRGVGIVGGQVGFQWTDVYFNGLNIPWSLSPAVELEGYYMGKSDFHGHDISNDTVRLPEHDFLVTYPLQTGVFLANAVLNFNCTEYARWHPFVAAGIGGAVLTITDADSLQVAPPEFNVNHYNGNPDDSVSVFAGQVKAGLNFDLTPHVSIFGEYRWLYLADSQFTFGSTVYPFHAATSPWLANFGSQHYNMGSAGLRVSV